MQTPPRTSDPRRRGPNGRFLPRPEQSEQSERIVPEEIGAGPVTLVEETPATEPAVEEPTMIESAVAEPAVREPAVSEPVGSEPIGSERELAEASVGSMVADLDADDDDDDDDEGPGRESGFTLPEDRFLNRELSWLDFNARVLALAEDPGTPLLERAKFLAIFASNLDEFYMVRVAGLKRRLSAGLPVRGGDRSSLRHQIEMITERTADLVTRHAACFADEVRPKLASESIELVSWKELDAPEQGRLRTYFREKVFPVLTPLAVDPAHPFPYISSRSLNLAVALRYPDGDNPELFARVKVPNNVPRFVTVQNDHRGVRFLPVEELIANHLDQLFPGMQILEWHLFRVTRNAELEVDEDRDEDLLQALERELAQRRFGPPVRLEVAASISDHVLDLLVRELDMDSQDVLRVPGILDLSSLWQVFGECDRDDLKDRPFVPATHPHLADGEVPRSVFNRLRESDILVHHPYHSFSTSV